VFCAGADLSERSGGGPSHEAAARPAPVDPAALFSRFRRSPKVYVGRIAGHCVAGGMGLAAAMDLTVAVDETEFDVAVAAAGDEDRPGQRPGAERQQHADHEGVASIHPGKATDHPSRQVIGGRACSHLLG
jgi:hypothetical protein